MAIEVKPEEGKEPEVKKPEAAKGKAKKEAKPKGPTRAERKEAFKVRGPFTFKGKKKVQSFTCICGSKGQNAIVLHDKDGQEVLTGETCARYLGVEVPKETKKKVAV